MYVHGFRFFSLPSPGFFSPFPHGTGSLSVSQEYLALRMVPPYSDRIPRVPPYSSSSQQVCFRVRDYHPVPSDFPDRSTNTQADSDSGLLPVRSPLLGESRLISFLGVLRCFSSPVRLVNLCIQLTIVQRIALGFPIRTSPGQGFISPRRRFSQISTSFIASDCQGIHRVRLVA